MAVTFYEKIKEIYETHQSVGWYSDITEDLHTISPFSNKRACVLVCIREDSQGVIHVLLTVRSNTVSTHKGEVCLPGGMVDSNDSSLLHTALREAEEEINIKSSQVYFVGYLRNYSVWNTRDKLYYMCSCVLVTLAVDMHELQLQPNTAEVSHIFWMPLKLFLGGGTHHTQRALSTGCPFPLHKLDMYFFTYQANDTVYTIWGLTATFMIFAAILVYQSPPHFPYTTLCIITTSDSKELPAHSTSERHLGIMRLPNNSSQNNSIILKSKI